MKKLAIACCLLLFETFSVCAEPGGLLLLQQPTLSKTHIAFVYAGQLWRVPRQGGEAQLLTSGSGTKSNPVFSPDGSLLAYTGNDAGNLDVYVMPSAGGMPRRLTHHPSADKVVGWSPDGKQILFRSSRNSYSFFERLFVVSLSGGLPKELPLPMAKFGSLSPDGKRIAYVPVDNDGSRAYIAWKRYRGGRASRIWLADLTDLSVEKLPRETSNDSNPMWVGDKVYFLSDRAGAVSLFVYDLHSKKVDLALPSNGADIKCAASSQDAIVYEQLGSLNLFDLASGKSTTLHITVPADLPGAQPELRKVGDQIVWARLSPTGAHALFEARGEIFTTSSDGSDPRNLTNTPGVMERDPAWSPDGKWIAYFSDQTGEYQLFIRQANGAGSPKQISLGDSPSFFYQPVWSPDSKRIAYTDKRLNMWYVDLANAASVKVDTDTYETAERSFNPSWSPDSRWISYTKALANHLHAVFAYSVDSLKRVQLTDGLSDCRFPVFDSSGLYLYFAASTDIGPATAWLDLSSINHPITRSVYLVVLRRDTPSPFLSVSHDEGPAEDRSAQSGPSGAQTPVQIDEDDIDQRILALPISPRYYTKLEGGIGGTIWLAENSELSGMDEQPKSLWRFDLASRKADKVAQRIDYFTVSFDGKTILYARGRQCYIAASTIQMGAPESALDLSSMETLVDPRAEWRQEFDEIWRIQRDFFYDPKLHGLDLRTVEQRYRPYLENLGSRGDFSYLMADMLGEITVGHMIVRTPSEPAPDQDKVGLLGADYVIEHGRYRFSRIYRGENWNPELISPLTQPGLGVHEGDYLLAVNDRELNGKDEVFERFMGLAGKSVRLRVGPSADGQGAHEITVVPIESELTLRNHAWIDQNRRKVKQLSGGRVAYVYLPDTDADGYSSFNRYFSAQVDCEGAIIDERFNDGGSAPDYIIDYLRRPLQNYWLTREGKDFTTPMSAIFGPKAMITNMYAGSGGDALAWYFRDAHIGPLVGTRTWGAMVGVYDIPSLMDGTDVTAPRIAFYNRAGDWEIENRGVAPDYEVEIFPRDWAAGHDPQLEKAVALVMDALSRTPLPVPQRPPFRNYQSREGVADTPAAGGSGH